MSRSKIAIITLIALIFSFSLYGCGGSELSEEDVEYAETVIGMIKEEEELLAELDEVWGKLDIEWFVDYRVARDYKFTEKTREDEAANILLVTEMDEIINELIDLGGKHRSLIEDLNPTSIFESTHDHVVSSMENLSEFTVEVVNAFILTMDISEMPGHLAHITNYRDKYVTDIDNILSDFKEYGIEK